MSAHRDADDAALTPAGRAALNEYLKAEGDRVLGEAKRLSSGGLVGAAEVVNAIGAIDARRQRPAPEWAVTELSYARRRELVSSLALSVVAAATACLALLAAIYDGSEDHLFTILAGILVVVAGLGLGQMLASRASRRRHFAYQLELEHRAGRPETLSWERPPTQRLAEMEFLEKWTVLEEQLRGVISQAGPPGADAERRVPVGEMLEVLRRVEVINKDDYDTTRALLRTRNAIVHGPGVTTSEIDRSLDALRRVAAKLSERGVAEQPGRGSSPAGRASRA